MGRHRAAKTRRKPAVGLAAAIAPAAVLFAAAADEFQLPKADTDPAAEAPLCCKEIVASGPAGVSWVPFTGQPDAAAPLQQMAATKYRVVERKPEPQVLPVGLAPERGLQVKTILVSRSISAMFPEILTIGGVRPDALPWHPHGLAIDVMIPNPGTAAGIALGNQIVSFVLKNSERFGIQDAIWRGTYYTPAGPRGSGYGHYDHVHITTTGGGYPTGGEVYVR